MAQVARLLTLFAFGLMALFGALGGVFVAGYAFDDLSLLTAVGVTALWVVPMVALSVYALRRPGPAGRVLVVATAVVLAASLADAVVGVLNRDALGPVAAVAVLALGVTQAFLGLHRQVLAGALMVVTGVVQLVATAVGMAVHAGVHAEGVPRGSVPGIGAMLGGSSGVVVVPLLVGGALFLLAGALAGQPGRTPPARPA